MQDLKNRILKDIKVEMTEEFDMNFKREAFFSKPWPAKRDVVNCFQRLCKTERSANLFVLPRRSQ